MPGIKSLIVPISYIGIADNCGLQTWSALWFIMSDLSHIGYSGNLCPLLFMNYVGRTLDWPLVVFRNVQVNLVGAIHLCVEPVHMISGIFSAPPALRRGVDTICCLYCGIFSRTNTHVRSLPVGFLWASWSRTWRVFLIRPVRIIYRVIKFSSCFYESHWRLLPWIFIICFCRR